MTRFYPNLGYKFALPGKATALASIVIGSTVTAHGLRRRMAKPKHDHLGRWLFDPQLYMAGVSAKATKVCGYLASYPWLRPSEIEKFDSGQHSQSSWNKDAQEKVGKLWPAIQGAIESDPQGIAKRCVTYQRQLSPSAIILPSPLTTDQSTDYSLELDYLDRGLDEAAGQGITGKKIYATIALADSCLRYWEPQQNPLLQLICDSVTSRDIDGVYVVIEQGQESADAKHCTNHKTLSSVLEIIHLIASDAGLRVVVNFVGGFGLVCVAAGAHVWGADWYKSLYRLRLADKEQEGRAYPSFWSHRLATEIHMKGDFNTIVEKGGLSLIKDATAASKGLMDAAKAGKKSDSVAAWAYTQTNVAAAREHFLDVMKRETKNIRRLEEAKRLDHVQDWLKNANTNAGKIANMLGTTGQTRLNHLDAWLSALTAYRERHSV